MKNYIKKIKKQFPILNNYINGYKLSYLDNSAMTQMPKNAINEILSYYCKKNSNIHRGIYNLSEISTKQYEKTRNKIKNYINSFNKIECIFFKNCTEGINFITNDYLFNKNKIYNNIIISILEHHSNFIPWYIICKKKKNNLKIIPIKNNKKINLNYIIKNINIKTKFLSITHICNSIGIINNIKYISKISNIKKKLIFIDAAQSLTNFYINITNLNIDFLTFNSHKFYGPNSLGILYGKKKKLYNIKNYIYGGGMIKYISFKNIYWNKIPYKFESGTQMISNIITFGIVIDFIYKIHYIYLYKYKYNIYIYTYNNLLNIKYINLLKFEPRSNIISFNLKKIHSHDFNIFISYYNLSIRIGHHCSIPLMNKLNINGTIRISFSIYNTYNDLNKFIYYTKKSIKHFINE